jgi:hypothetical protein
VSEDFTKATPHRTRDREPSPADADRSTADACQCSLCQESRGIREILQRRDPDEMARLIDRLCDSNHELAFDLEYHQCLLGGSWPNAVEILEEALKKAQRVVVPSPAENDVQTV